eukprot:m.348895 g.348895  ORF g.348895 m.348895 type:complete len:413 (+) comp27943_c0_seq4:154-1392(+)
MTTQPTNQPMGRMLAIIAFIAVFVRPAAAQDYSFLFNGCPRGDMASSWTNIGAMSLSACQAACTADILCNVIESNLCSGLPEEPVCTGSCYIFYGTGTILTNGNCNISPLISGSQRAFIKNSSPTSSPTASPTTSAPTSSPTTSSPTTSPTSSPTTSAPTISPTLSPTNVCSAFSQTFTFTVIGAGKEKGTASTGGKGGSSCNYAEAFGDALTAGFEASAGFPVGTGPLDDVLDSVVASDVGGCPTEMQAATVVLTYKPESTPVDPVQFADAARAWQAGEAFPITIEVCGGCSAKIDLIGTTSGYEGFDGKGTPKSGKCKGGFSPASTPKSVKNTKKSSSVAASVGTQSTGAAVATVMTVAVLVVIVAMAVIKRRTGLAKKESTKTELGNLTSNTPFATDGVVHTNPLFKSV